MMSDLYSINEIQAGIKRTKSLYLQIYTYVCQIHYLESGKKMTIVPNALKNDANALATIEDSVDSLMTLSSSKCEKKLAELKKEYLTVSRRYSDNFATDLFPGTLQQCLRSITAQDANAIENAIRYLEVDPYCHRSGYAKTDLLRKLKQAKMSDKQIVRVLQCSHKYFLGGCGQVFVGYAKFIACHATVSWLQALKKSMDLNVAIIATRMQRLDSILQSSKNYTLTF